MFQSTIHGYIEVICGSMFSGKTEELMRRVRRAQYARQKVQVFKPVIDQRYSATHVQSHDANRIPSILVMDSSEVLDQIKDQTQIVAIDEVQFFDAGVVDVAQKLANRRIRVLVAGLDMDSMGRPFGPMPQLLAIAESVTKLTAVCVVCGAPATRSQRLVARLESESSDPILVGAAESYEPRCRFCHEATPLDKTVQEELFSKPLSKPGLKPDFAGGAHAFES